MHVSLDEARLQPTNELLFELSSAPICGFRLSAQRREEEAEALRKSCKTQHFKHGITLIWFVSKHTSQTRVDGRWRTGENYRVAIMLPFCALVSNWRRISECCGCRPWRSTILFCVKTSYRCSCVWLRHANECIRVRALASAAHTVLIRDKVTISKPITAPTSTEEITISQYFKHDNTKTIPGSVCRILRETHWMHDKLEPLDRVRNRKHDIFEELKQIRGKSDAKRL